MSLEVGRCGGCGRMQFGGASCGHCGGALRVEEISGRGEIYSYTRVHVAPGELGPPYLLVLVEFEEGGRMMGRLEGEGKAQVDVGAPVVFSKMTKNGPLFVLGPVSDRPEERNRSRV
ncbi:MAG: OB-fold domain-containing protein [bacterium]|nr:OB-fold domain-containing protein [bacterium]